MYCERCGNQLTEGTRFCSNCGKPQGLAVVPIDRQGRVERNLQVLGILWLVAGSLELLGSFVLLVLGNVIFRFGSAFRPDVPVAPFLHGLFTFLGVLVGLKCLLSFASGWGLLQRETWARPLSLVAAFLALLHIPFGTALGIYTIWVLLPLESSQEYDQLSKAA
jgi:hypothetical protein